MCNESVNFALGQLIGIRDGGTDSLFFKKKKTKNFDVLNYVRQVV